ncbi:kinase-like domain-containing protein [Mucor mucedo]|uniref:kinase-like domain-containing protein n=1 Tax=Mucor mucedo TaxID=29922 RepID=UPI00221E8DBD|nr:kinase-like domain-containing protein [Mucor mucedo]KAI7896652.1 kinase-like domain-containing protein [Mucor mucedo]
MQSTMPSFAPDTPQPYFYPPTIPENHRSNPNSRRTSTATTNNNTSPSRSSRSMRDRRRSSGAISTHSSQKPKKCIGDYVVGKTLGKGASGRVKLGVHRHTGEQVAIKIISKAHLAANPAIEKAVRREIAIMKLIHHPNVMSLIDVIDDPASSDLYLILEYVEGGELFEYLVSKGRLGEAEARHHFQQIILGLDYCHHHLICHRDLKPENLLLNSRNSIKIADFGMASLQPLGSMLETSCGSPHYASPEIVAGMPYNGSSCDIWSCGVILYALLTGHLPFDDENIRQLLKKVKSGKYVMPDNISRSAQDLIRRILVVDPSRRLNMQQIMAHPWFCETEPINMTVLPVPPTEKEIGQPVADASEIDDRILETIKFLWGETSNDTVINALVQKEHNMQKVVYVLLQQHAERYWQADHDDESEDDTEDTYSDAPRRRYRTIGHRTERDRRCLSMVDTNTVTSASSKKSPAAAAAAVGNRPVAPWMPSDSMPSSPTLSNRNDVLRRNSAATVKAERSPAFDDLPANPPLPNNENMSEEKRSKMKKSETFYARFVKNVLTSGRRQSKDTRNTAEQPPFGTPTSETGTTAPQSTSKPIAATLVGTLRRKNPFQRAPINTTDFAISPSSMNEEPVSPVVPPKSTLRPTSNILQRNKIDPADEEDEEIEMVVENHRKSNKSATLSSKRLSLRLPNAFRTSSHKEGDTVSSKKFGFTLGSNSRKQRKQLDLSLFETEQQMKAEEQEEMPQIDSRLVPPPILCDVSNNKGMPPTFKTVMHKSSNPNVFASGTPRRPSQASFKSIDRRGSNISSSTLGQQQQQQQNRPATPSLLSNSSTINSPVISHHGNIPSQPAKSSWLSNLFIFKQPKVCSLVVYSTHTAGILRSLHRLMNTATEARFYEKPDRTGVIRYKAEIKTKPTDGSKVRQVKCRIDLIMSDLDPQSCVVQFTQQQGDGVLLNTTVQQLHEAILKEYPCPSNIILSSDSYKEMNSEMTSGTLVEEY